jgi:sugar fermentation stimulation protein A
LNKEALAPLFANVVKGRFIDRPNRFIVHCEVQGEIIEAYLPNPGRMWELLFADVVLFLVPNAADLKTRFTVVAVEREGQPIMVHTHATNEAVGRLLAAGRIPGLQTATVVQREVTVGSHRFDFLLNKNGKPFYLEVKSCTLFEGKIAMFPDAVTLRGRRHLAALAELVARDIPCGVLFLVHWPQAEFFLPDYHTDLAFAQTFCQVKPLLTFYPVAINWEADFSFASLVKPLIIPWQVLETEIHDSGSYIMIMELKQTERITVGSLGTLDFPPGFYLYIGTAKKNLTQRINRHLRKRKQYHWHIDYLRAKAENCTAVPIRSSEMLEHHLAQAVAVIADWQVPDFGASDCHCATHLLAMQDNPLHNTKFIKLLQYFRIGRLMTQLDCQQAREPEITN